MGTSKPHLRAFLLGATIGIFVLTAGCAGIGYGLSLGRWHYALALGCCGFLFGFFNAASNFHDRLKG
jgi:hypothetical protein